MRGGRISYRAVREQVLKENIVKCKDAIVDSMNTNAVFVLPESMFIDRESELSMLESCCLIARINHLIAFVHQSFWTILLQLTPSGRSTRAAALLISSGRGKQIPICGIVYCWCSRT